MKNKKIIFLVATVCCLAVCWFCFGAWTIADTNFVVGDFNTSTSTMYLYIVPSSNIVVDTYSNVAVDYIFTASGSSTVVSQQRLLSSLTAQNGTYRLSSNAFSSSVNQAILNVSISSIDISTAQYFISACYVINNSEFVSVELSRSNYVRHIFTPNFNRTLILFIDKVTTSGVPQEQYDELLQRYEDLEYDFSDLESDYDDLYIEVQEYIALYNQELAINTALNTRIEELQARIDSLESGGTALDFVGTAFEKVGDILAIEILPNGITIGTIVAVPLILGVVFLVLRLVRGE